jgi:hypothetical protein
MWWIFHFATETEVTSWNLRYGIFRAAFRADAVDDSAALSGEAGRRVEARRAERSEDWRVQDSIPDKVENGAA